MGKRIREALCRTIANMVERSKSTSPAAAASMQTYDSCIHTSKCGVKDSYITNVLKTYLTDAQDFTLLNILLAIIKKITYKVKYEKKTKILLNIKVQVKSIKFKYKWKNENTTYKRLHT